MEQTDSRAAALRWMVPVKLRSSRNLWLPVVLWAALATMFLVGPLVSRARAQASLAAEDIAQDVKVKIDGVEETFTVVRDALQRNQWYYMPNSPRLYERSFQGRREPEFSLIRYQFPDPDDPARLLEGGILQFAATLAITPEALDQLKRAVVDKFTGTRPEEVRLSGMPLKSAKVSLLSPQKGTLLSSQPQGCGIGPATASHSKMIFLLELTSNGTDIYEKLTRGSTGVPVHIEFVYLGLTPKAAIKVTVDWDQAYTYYSGDEKFRARASWFGLVSAGASADLTKIREELTNNRVIRMEAIEGENFDIKSIDQYMQPILKQINDVLLEELKPPSYFEPGRAVTPESGGFFGGVGYSVAIKEVGKVKKGTEVIDFRVQRIMERATIADGFLGIGKYPKEVQDRLVTVLESGRSAYFLLPPVGDGLGIEEVDLEVAINGAEDLLPAEKARWNSNQGWTRRVENPSGRLSSRDVTSASVLSIPLNPLPAELRNRRPGQFQFKVTTKILTQSNQLYKGSEIVATFNGRKAVSPPTSGVDVVRVTGRFLPWRMINEAGQLNAVDIKLACGEQSLRTRMAAKRINGVYYPPDPVNFFVEKTSNGERAPIFATITYELEGRPALQWEDNGKDLRKLGMTVVLDPTNWPREGKR